MRVDRTFGGAAQTRSNGFLNAHARNRTDLWARHNLENRMEIETTRHVDAADNVTGGGRLFSYEYDLYRFSDGAVVIVARSYTNQPDEAHFLRAEADGHWRMLEADELRTPLFEQATSYLRSIGKSEISWLSERAGGYELVKPI